MAVHRQLVAVTGGSGFIATHIIIALMNQGYRVRTTLRRLDRTDEVRSMLAQGGAAEPETVETVQADLTSDDNWDQAVDGATYVIHVASPTPATRPRGEAEMVSMAVGGVTRVMTAAKAARVRRVVLTSASGAIIAGHKRHPDLFTEEDWTNLNGRIDAYQRSKTVAERAAWQFSANEDLPLAVVNPVAVMGPVLGADFSHSNQIIQSMLSGKMPYLLRLGFDYVDVRDVADLHLLAMTRPEAVGQRFIATSGQNLTYLEEATILKDNLGTAARRVSTKEVPDLVVRLLAPFSPTLRMPATFLGRNTACSNEKARALLGWRPRSGEEAILATAKSLVELGLVGAGAKRR
ncbi:MAG: aldehyde reductase [Propionibacteriaceae bacterium]|jgi:nucleoside-diphosphate-sugar epimerase|nr:aldehyde reductase [Propionibacteriaceae bacterium]